MFKARLRANVEYVLGTGVLLVGILAVLIYVMATSNTGMLCMMTPLVLLLALVADAPQR